MNTKHSKRKLIFDAALDPSENLDVHGKGTLRKGEVVITVRDRDTHIGAIHYSEAWEDSETGEKFPAFYSISTALPSESFETLLNADLDEAQIFLRFITDLGAPGITYGYDPDGKEKQWDVAQANPLDANTLIVAIVPREKPEPDLDEYRHVDVTPSALAPQPVVVIDPQLTRQLRSLWWAVVVIGGLALVKLYR